MGDKLYRVIVWCAVSSKQQATEDKASLPTQEAEGREFAEAVGGVVTDVLTVPGHSRDIVLFEDAAREMSAYQQLRDHCEASDFDVLWARDPDRLGRDPALAQTVASLVERSGAEVYVASAPHQLGQGGAGQRYVYAIQSVRAGEDQARRVRYHSMGMRRRVEAGLMPGRLPYGYRAIRDHLTGRVVGAELDEGAGAVRLATEMYIRGETYSAIARVLNASAYRAPQAERWSVQTVKRWFLSDTYAGISHWGGFRIAEPSSAYPALWDEATHRAVRRERARRDGRRYRKRGSSPLLDVAFCARCGGRMTQCRKPNGSLRLRCSTHSRKNLTGIACHPNQIRLDVVMDAIADYLTKIVDLDALNEQLSISLDREPVQRRLDEIEQHLETEDHKRSRLALAYASGSMDMAMYRQVDDQILDGIERLCAEADDLQAKLSLTVDPQERLEAIGDVREVLAEALVMVPPLEVATALANIGLRVEIEDRRVVAVLLV